MRVTIIREDGAVVVDGERHTVDCGTLPADFHALQWNGNAGEIEYSVKRCEHCGARTKRGNTVIFDFALYQPYVDAWHVAKANAEKAAEAVKLEAEKHTDAAGPKS